MANYTNLKTQSTSWVFLLAAAKDNQHRHLMDLAWGLKNLIKAGIKKDDIHIYIDVPAAIQGSVKNYLSILHYQFTTKNLDDFFTNNTTKLYDNSVFFILGHGSSNGLDSFTTITPYKLINKIKNTPNLKNAVLYLGQCYAGIFNYLEVGKNKDDEKAVALTIIGATELHNSISYRLNDHLYQGMVQNGWIANLFIYNLFKWIANPLDIDGDGLFSILDSYKYIEIETNLFLKKISSGNLFQFVEAHSQLSLLQQQLLSTNDVQEKNNLTLKIAYFDSIINEKLEIFTIKQESWLLNANHSRIIGL